MATEHFDADHIHTTPEGRHFRHSDGVEVDGEGLPITRTGQVTGTFFSWTLEKNHLSVQHERYAEDPCAGQNQAISALFLAREELGLDRASEITHSGGYASCWVKPQTDDE